MKDNTRSTILAKRLELTPREQPVVISLQWVKYTFFLFNMKIEKSFELSLLSSSDDDDDEFYDRICVVAAVILNKRSEK